MFILAIKQYQMKFLTKSNMISNNFITKFNLLFQITLSVD